jgi:two-component system response regulator GlrR
MSLRLLIVGQDHAIPDSDIGSLLKLEHWSVEHLNWAKLTPQSLQHSNFDLVVIMAVSETEEALRFFQWLRAQAVTFGTLAVLAVEPDVQMRELALDVVDDFVLWPATPHELRYRMTRILELRQNSKRHLSEQLSTEFGMAEIVGKDPVFARVLRKIPALARSDAPVLITGETGTGKEICAQAIHHIGRRNNFPLIPMDCTSVPHHLFENEIFGHSPGAFTDARREQKGLAAMAAGGTLFLDEIDALDLGAQAKLLRFLQDGTYKPLGTDRFIHSDVRVIAATNRNIEALVSSGQFRPDLYYRLNVLRLDLPPLRERRGDITLLAWHFLSSLTPAGAKRKSFSTAALRKLVCYDWPGNVRELLNVVQHALVFAESSQILPCHIPVPVCVVESETSSGLFREARTRTIEAFERQYVQEMIRKHNGNVTRAAREAGKERRSFGRMIKKYGLNRAVSDPGQRS